MSSSPPTLPATRAFARNDFVRPLAIASLLVCALVLVWCLLQTLALWALSGSGPWQILVAAAEEKTFPPSVLWRPRPPVTASLRRSAGCVPSTLASWGLYRQRRWGLWSYVWLLVLSGLANLVLAGWLDAVVAEMIAHVDDAATRSEMQVQRLLMSATTCGGSIVILGLQGWLAWRLLRPDIRARFR